MSRRRQAMRACPTPSKRRYADPNEAQIAYEQELATSSLPAAQISNCAYQCRCGWWHRSKVINDGTGVRFS